MFCFKTYNIIVWLQNLPVIQCTPIVRCRICRTYINPFVYFMDEKHWKCNLCFRVNECKFDLIFYLWYSDCNCIYHTVKITIWKLFVAVPDEFQYDPATKTYGEPMRRPEVKSATIEFIAPAEYMVRVLLRFCDDSGTSFCKKCNFFF